MIQRSYIDGEIIEVLRLCLKPTVLNYGEAYMTETIAIKTKYPKLVKRIMQATMKCQETL
jgi:hypothetical protein